MTSPRSISGSSTARVEVVSAAIVRDARVLLGQRAPSGSFPWAFCTPGGKVELGEDHLDALRRELCEELGVGLSRALTVRALSSVEIDPPEVKRPLRVTCYRIDWADVIGAPMPLDGLVGLSWLVAEELDGIHNLTPSDARNREAIRRMLVDERARLTVVGAQCSAVSERAT